MGIHCRQPQGSWKRLKYIFYKRIFTLYPLSENQTMHLKWDCDRQNMENDEQIIQWEHKVNLGGHSGQTLLFFLNSNILTVTCKEFLVKEYKSTEKNGTKMSEKPSVIYYWRLSLLAQAVTKNYNSLWQNCFPLLHFQSVIYQEWFFPPEKSELTASSCDFRAEITALCLTPFWAQWEINVGISLANPSCSSWIKELGLAKVARPRNGVSMRIGLGK